MFHAVELLLSNENQGDLYNSNANDFLKGGKPLICMNHLRADVLVDFYIFRSENSWMSTSITIAVDFFSRFGDMAEWTVVSNILLIKGKKDISQGNVQVALQINVWWLN